MSAAPSRIGLLKDQRANLAREQARLQVMQIPDEQADLETRRNNILASIAKRRIALDNEITAIEADANASAARLIAESAATQAAEELERKSAFAQLVKKNLTQRYGTGVVSASVLRPDDRRLIDQVRRELREAQEQNTKAQETLASTREQSAAARKRMNTANAVTTELVDSACIPCTLDTLAYDLRQQLAADIFPGHQSFGNCGVQSVQQIIRLATNTTVAERDLLDVAIGLGANEGTIDPSGNGPVIAGQSRIAGTVGGTNAAKRNSILEAYGVAMLPPVATTEDALANAIRERQGIVANVDAGQLWHGTASGGGHAVVVTNGEFDADGKLVGVFINDTGRAKPDEQRRYLPLKDFMAAVQARKDGGMLNLTRDAIWP